MQEEVVDEVGRWEEVVDEVERGGEVHNPENFPWRQTILPCSHKDLKVVTGPGKLQELAQREQVLRWEPRQVGLLRELALQEQERRGDQEQ
jgi:hypothetical protein